MSRLTQASAPCKPEIYPVTQPSSSQSDRRAPVGAVVGALVVSDAPEDFSNLKPWAAPHVEVLRTLNRHVLWLLSDDGPWSVHPSRATLAAVARACISMTDQCGVFWGSDATIREWSGFKESAVERALREIAGPGDGAPGVLYARRRLRHDEAYVRAGEFHLKPCPFYYAHRPSGLHAVGGSPQQRPQRGLSLGPALKAAAVPGCAHTPRCRSRSQHSRLLLPSDYFASDLGGAS